MPFLLTLQNCRGGDPSHPPSRVRPSYRCLGSGPHFPKVYGCVRYILAPRSRKKRYDAIYSFIRSLIFLLIFVIFLLFFSLILIFSLSALLGFAPNLETDFDFTAESQLNFLRYVLGLFGRTLDDVLCLIGDNCNVNKSLADQAGLPLIGCASHRFNLEVTNYLTQFEGILSQVCLCYLCLYFCISFLFLFFSFC